MRRNSKRLYATLLTMVIALITTCIWRHEIENNGP